MMDPASPPSYLCCTLAFLGIWGVSAALSARERRMAVALSALLTLPLVPWCALLGKSYWNPPRLWGLSLMGAEDFLFAFAAAGIAWRLATLPVKGRLTFSANPGRVLGKCMILVLIGAPLAAGTAAACVKPIWWTVIPVVLIGGGLALIRPSACLLVPFGALGYSVLHWLVLRVSFSLFPGFPASWNADNLLGPLVWGVPLDEIIWAAAFGAVWPVFTAFVLDVRFEKKGRPCRIGYR